jgi:hypothetical protein
MVLHFPILGLLVREEMQRRYRVQCRLLAFVELRLCRPCTSAHVFLMLHAPVRAGQEFRKPATEFDIEIPEARNRRQSSSTTLLFRGSDVSAAAVLWMVKTGAASLESVDCADALVLATFVLEQASTTIAESLVVQPH